uniref:RRM domain-containing protein n=1 Tax=Zooxanthella nutricula TaxID=1333877 RepID=A0A7S2QFQ1_9DINO
MSALVRITTGIMAQHSRVGVSRAMSQFGEVIHCHKPPYSGIPGEDFVNVRFASQDAADRAYAALKAGQVFIDGFQVGVGPTPGGGGGGGKGGGGMAALADHGRRRSVSPPRHYGRNRQRSPLMSRRRSPPMRRPPSPPQVANFPSRNDPKSPSPRRLARDMHMRPRNTAQSRSRSRSRREDRMDRMRRYREERPTTSSFSFAQADQAGPAMAMKLRDKPARTPSPDPPGPAKNNTQVKNFFFKADRSPTPELYEPERMDVGSYYQPVATM